jgi:hypothetical protein
LRLALLLAALAFAGPMPPAGIDAARLDVSIAWFSTGRIVSPRRQPSNTPILSDAVARNGFNESPASVFSPALLPHSLYQRPPPLPN